LQTAIYRLGQLGDKPKHITQIQDATFCHETSNDTELSHKNIKKFARYLF